MNFNNLFVLEMANNHLGDVDRGLKIINEHGKIVRANSIKAAIKLQFRDVDNFVHEKSKDIDERYIKKTLKTKLTEEEFGILVKEIINVGCIPTSTPFDEKSVELCEKFDFPFIKIASSDINDWPLIEKIAETKKPVIASTGGAREIDIDNLVKYFNNRGINLAINHCVSLYPTPDEDLSLGQIKYLKERYPDNLIGFSTHEFNDWSSSMLMSYALGARTWERHIDINYNGVGVSKYNSLPKQIDTWFNYFHLAEKMYGNTDKERRNIKQAETEYLDKLLRGIYAKKSVDPGVVINKFNFNEYFYLAIPLNKGQLSCREILNGTQVISKISKDEPLMIENIQGPLKDTEFSYKMIKNRGLDL